MKRILIITILFLGVCVSNAQEIHSLSELEDKLIQYPKNLVIKFSTDWCGICKIQDRKIQKNKELNEILNHSIYYLEFDAESTETFKFKGIEFKPRKNKMHEFTETLLEGNQTYPAWVILNSDLEIIFKYNGLLNAEELLSIFKEIL